MSSDPRLNLAAYAQVQIGPASVSIGARADSCSTSKGQNLFADLSANAAKGSILPGNIGAFANLQLGQGGGTVGAGLTGLASISDSIRINGSSPEMSVSLNATAGAQFVLGKVGLSSQGLSAVGQVNSAVAANASIQAGIVFNQVQSGTFTNANITAAFSPFQNAHVMLSTIFSVGNAAAPQGSRFGAFCGAKPYAIDLINLAPKYKFLFVVEFEFDPEFQEILSNIDPAFVVKHSTRPQVDFEYQDINMYNFRTKVPTKTIYQPMSMKFYDDDFNNAFQFYATYMKLMSPIANIDIQTQAVDPLDAYETAGGGMGFGQGPLKIQTIWNKAVGQSYAGSLGPYGNIPQGSSNSSGGAATGPDIRNVLRRITLYQVYKQGRMMNVFHFYNPKITVLTLDDMDMATAGEGNEVSITFSYDSVYIIPGYSLINGPANLVHLTDDGIYPFGIEPHSVSPKFNSPDGAHHGRMGLGQDNVANAANIQLVSIPASVAKFNPNAPQTTSGTSLANLPAAPTNVGGGNSQDANIQGGTPGELSDVTVTAQRLPDPITGSVQNSANNIPDLGNTAASGTQDSQVTVDTATNTVTTAQSALTDAQANLSTAQYQANLDPSPANQATLAAAVEQTNTAQTNVTTANSQLTAAQSAARNTTVPSTTYNSGGGSQGTGGVSGSGT